MAEVPKFDAKADRRGVPEVDVRTGGADAWLELAQASSSFTRKIGDMADRAAASKGELAGQEVNRNFGLPSPDLSDPAIPVKEVRDDRQPSNGRPPRGVRNNNPGNIEFGDYAKSKGAIGSDGRFAQFSSPEAGIAAMRDLLGIYQNRHGLKTVREMIGRWAPAGENDTKAYAVRVASRMGIKPDEQFDFNDQRLAQSMVGAMIEVENGYLPYGTGAPTVTASAVPPLQVSPAAGGPPATTPSQEPPATIQPLILTRGTSIREQAFDRAALGMAADRLDVQAFQNLEAIALKYPDQPEQALEAIEAYAASVRSQVKQPELVTRFDNIVGRHRLAIVREASQKSEAKRKDDREAAFLDNWTTRRTALVRLARRLPDGGDGDQAVALELTEMEGLLGTAGGDLTPAQRVALKRELAQDVGTARVMAGFERIKDPKTRRAYAQSFEEAWTKGEGKTLGIEPDTFEAIRRDMQQQITRDQVEQEKLARETGTKVEQLINRLGKGYAVPPEERAAIKGAVEASGDPVLAQNYKFFDALATWQTGARLARPETLTATIAAEEARMNRDGATAQDIDALDAMKKLRDTIAEGVDKDMLGLAERMNLTAVPALNPENFTKSLTARKATAETIAAHYGREPQYFKQGEVEALTRAFAVNPDQLIGFAVSLRESMGERTPVALKQLSKQAPMIAHAAGIAFATKNDRLLRETAEAMKRKAVDGYKPVKLPEAQKDLAIAGILGPALSRLPETQAAALETADMLFDLRVQASGVDPASEEARAIYEGALNDALGREGSGGGVQDVNGVETLLPPGRTGADVEGALNSLVESDVARLPPIAPVTGYPVTAAQLRNAKLVATSLGTYWVALGNPRSDNPRYLARPDGEMWTLTIEDLLALTKGRALLDDDAERLINSPVIGLGSTPMPITEAP